jgi:hypothetical protein
MILAALFVLSNSISVNSDTSLKDGWKIITMGRWTIEVPSNFKDSSLKPYDTYVGIVYSKTDSFYFGYEWSISPDSIFDGDSFIQLGEDNCELKDQIKRTQEEITSPLNGWQESYGDTNLYRIQIDTINSTPAIIVTPVKGTAGDVVIKISNCKPRGFIEIWSKNLSTEKKNLLLEIGNTIKMK